MKSIPRRHSLTSWTMAIVLSGLATPIDSFGADEQSPTDGAAARNANLSKRVHRLVDTIKQPVQDQVVDGRLGLFLIDVINSEVKSVAEEPLPGYHHCGPEHPRLALVQRQDPVDPRLDPEPLRNPRQGFAADPHPVAVSLVEVGRSRRAIDYLVPGPAGPWRQVLAHVAEDAAAVEEVPAEARLSVPKDGSAHPFSAISGSIQMSLQISRRSLSGFFALLRRQRVRSPTVANSASSSCQLTKVAFSP